MESFWNRVGLFPVMFPSFVLMKEWTDPEVRPMSYFRRFLIFSHLFVGLWLWIGLVWCLLNCCNIVGGTFCWGYETWCSPHSLWQGWAGDKSVNLNIFLIKNLQWNNNTLGSEPVWNIYQESPQKRPVSEVISFSLKGVFSGTPCTTLG